MIDAYVSYRVINACSAHSCINTRIYNELCQDLEDSFYVSSLLVVILRALRYAILQFFDGLNVSSLETIFKNSPLNEEEIITEKISFSK